MMMEMKMSFQSPNAWNNDDRLQKHFWLGWFVAIIHLTTATKQNSRTHAVRLQKWIGNRGKSARQQKIKVTVPAASRCNNNQQQQCHLKGQMKNTNKMVRNEIQPEHWHTDSDALCIITVWASVHFAGTGFKPYFVIIINATCNELQLWSHIEHL